LKNNGREEEEQDASYLIERVDKEKEKGKEKEKEEDKNKKVQNKRKDKNVQEI
jgi:hypothetical protein